MNISQQEPYIQYILKQCEEWERTHTPTWKDTQVDTPEGLKARQAYWKEIGMEYKGETTS